MLVALELHPNGPRVRIAHQRLHHGAVGCALLAHPNKYVRFLGACLALHDMRDAAVWFRFGWQD